MTLDLLGDMTLDFLINAVVVGLEAITLDLLTKAAIIALCGMVILGSICRLDMMHARSNRGEWIALYTLAATFSAGMVLDLVGGREIDWHEVAGVAALLLQLHSTRRLWIDGPPPNTRKGTL